jgi:hypothetical protein
VVGDVAVRGIYGGVKKILRPEAALNQTARCRFDQTSPCPLNYGGPTFWRARRIQTPPNAALLK